MRVTALLIAHYLFTFLPMEHALCCFYRLNVLSIRTNEQFGPLISAVKAHHVYVTPFLNTTERMESLHEKPYRTHRPPENAIRNVDMAWHAPRNVEARPPAAPVGALYNGFAVHMENEKNIFLVYNNTRHLFADEESMRKMGFDFDCVLSFRRNDRHPVAHRIMENIPQGENVPAEGVTVRITPSYELRPLH